MKTTYLNIMRDIISKSDKIEQLKAELGTLKLMEEYHGNFCGISIDIKTYSGEAVCVDLNHNTLSNEVENILNTVRKLLENEIDALESEVYTLQLRLENEK